jgi:hypothetical protein
MEATQRQEEAAAVHREQRDALMIELMVMIKSLQLLLQPLIEQPYLRLIYTL